MAKHRRVDSHEAATETGPGRSEKTRGHPQLALWVEATGLDPSVDEFEVRAEVSPDDVHYAPIDSGSPAVDDTMFLNQNDLTQSDEDENVYVGYIRTHNNPVEHVRANIVTHTGTAEVTTYVFIGGWSGRGKSYKEREDLPKNQLGRGSN